MGGSPIAATAEPPPADLTVARARAGDLGAFEDLYRRHVARVYAICLRMTADPARAEDHTQETFVRVWQKLHTFRGETGFPAWLSRVAANVVISERRVGAPRERRERPLEAVPALPAPGTPSAGTDLERAIAGLPTRARDVFVLHDVEGYRHHEIARLLDVEIGTSKSQLHRARKLLREALSR